MRSQACSCTINRPPGPQQASHSFQRAGQVGDVVERPVRQDRVERARAGELLQRDGLEDVALWRVRIDRDDLVTAARDGPGEITVAAPDLEHPCGSRRKLGLDEGRDIHPSPSTTP
jgi:hypothetical protein